MEIREEQQSDATAVQQLHRAAFAHQADQVDGLVRDLRRSLMSEPGLSLVAVDARDEVVGHALFTRNLLDAPSRLVDVQVLSPVGVRPDVQRRGVGSAMIRHGIKALAARGVPAVFLEGSPDYYSRFGFEAGMAHSFRRPSRRIPRHGFQVLLLPAHEPWMTGTLVYRQDFWHHDLVGLRPSDPHWHFVDEPT